MLCTGTRINVFWPNVGKSGAWFMATVRNTTERGTYCVYDDGDKHYHDLYEEKYVVLTMAEAKHKQNKLTKKQKMTHTFDKDALEREMQCAICLDFMSEPMTLKECSHSYCKTCLVTHLAVSKKCPLCPWVHVNSKRDAWHNIPLKKTINIYKCNDDDSGISAETSVSEKPDTPTKTKRNFRCSICKGFKVASAQKCSFPCTEGSYSSI